jgi:osmoprotectant transport system permease protein
VITAASGSGKSWLDWTWVKAHESEIWSAVRQHLAWAGTAFGLGLVAVLFLVLVARRSRALDRALRGVAIVAGAIPFVAVLAAMAPTVVNRGRLVGAVAGSVAALVFRNVMLGLDGVDNTLVDEAVALGHGRVRRLAGLELPMARGHLRGALRIGAVTALGLVAVAGPDLDGGLGRFVRSGFESGPRTQRVVGIMALVAIALVADLFVRALVRKRGGKGGTVRP